MKLLLTSNGVANASMEAALEELLGKPIAAARALFIPTGIYPFAVGATHAMRTAQGHSQNRLCELGWQSLGLLELTALPSINREVWMSVLAETDALLVGGGHVMYLSYWLRASGLLEVAAAREDLVYVGVSAGSIALSSLNCDAESNRRTLPNTSDAYQSSDAALGVIDTGLWVHVDSPNPMFAEHTMANVGRWAATHELPTYALDDQSALRVEGDVRSVVSEGTWQFFNRDGVPLLSS